ncbi:MAG: RidA family protein [Streptomycetaceae bacterium]|nr:RidA family protein [Streptomycetaceae bacterium]
MTTPAAATSITVAPADFPWYDPVGFTFSLGLRVGRDVWCSGHSGSARDPATGRPGIRGGMADQARIAYAKQTAVLAAAGLDLGHVTRVVENVTVAGLPEYAEAERVRRELFGDRSPVVVTVVVDRLVRRTALVEIEVHAASEAKAEPTTKSTAKPTERVSVEHNGSVLLPTLLPIDAHGSVVAPDDPARQYAYCLARAAALLDPLYGAHLVATTDFVTPTGQRAAHHLDRIRADLLGPVPPAGTRVLTTGQHRDGIHVAVEAVASRHTPLAVDPLGLADALPGRSPAVRAGDLLYLSGFGPLADGAGDLRHQAESLYGTVLHTLAAVGAGPEHLLSTVEFVSADALPDYRAVADVRRAQLKEPYPVSTGIVCTRMAHPSALLDVAAVAAVPAAASAVPGEA